MRGDVVFVSGYFRRIRICDYRDLATIKGLLRKEGFRLLRPSVEANVVFPALARHTRQKYAAVRPEEDSIELGGLTHANPSSRSASRLATSMLL